MNVHFTERELATVLAALRYWQQDLAENDDEGPISPEHFTDRVTPLSVEEIDALCERLNYSGATLPILTSPRMPLESRAGTGM